MQRFTLLLITLSIRLLNVPFIGAQIRIPPVGTTAPMSSSWSEHGRPLPHLPHVPFDANKGVTMADNYGASLSAAGHPAFGLPLPSANPRLTSAGGTTEGTNAARADSWKRALAFLKANLEH